jgi:hypothetical protein
MTNMANLNEIILSDSKGRRSVFISLNSTRLLLTLILYKLTLSYGLKSYMTSRRPIGEREAIRHAFAVVGKLRAYT